MDKYFKYEYLIEEKKLTVDQVFDCSENTLLNSLCYHSDVSLHMYAKSDDKMQDFCRLVSESLWRDYEAILRLSENSRKRSKDFDMVWSNLNKK